MLQVFIYAFLFCTVAGQFDQEAETIRLLYPDLPPLMNGNPVLPQERPVRVESVKDVLRIIDYTNLMTEWARHNRAPQISIAYVSWGDSDPIIHAIDQFMCKNPIQVVEITARSDLVRIESIKRIFDSHAIRKFVLVDYSIFNTVKNRITLEELGSLVKSAKSLKAFETSPRLFKAIGTHLRGLKSLGISCDQYYESDGWLQSLRSTLNSNPGISTFEINGAHCNYDMGEILGVLSEYGQNIQKIFFTLVSDPDSVRQIIKYFDVFRAQLKEFKAVFGKGAADQASFLNLARSLHRAPSLSRASLAFQPGAFKEAGGAIAVFNSLPGGIDQRTVVDQSLSISSKAFATQLVCFNSNCDELSELIAHLSSANSQQILDLIISNISVEKLAEHLEEVQPENLWIRSLKIQNLSILKGVAQRSLQIFAAMLSRCLTFDIQLNSHQMKHLMSDMSQLGLISSNWIFGNDRLRKLISI